MTSEATSDESAATVCWCCGEERGEPELARLECHSEVALCDTCLDWLGDKQALRRGNRLRRAVPILATADVARALEHYAALGFETEAWQGGGYGFASRDGVELHLGEVEGHDPQPTSSAITSSWATPMRCTPSGSRPAPAASSSPRAIPTMGSGRAATSTPTAM